MTRRELEELLKEDLKHIHLHGSDWTYAKLIRLLEKVYNRGHAQWEEDNLKEIVFDVAAVVLATPSAYPEGGGPPIQPASLIQYNLNKYIHDKLSEVKAKNQGTP